MKKIALFFVSICLGATSYSQQLPQVTQYMINNYAVNPAVSGMYDYFQVKTTIRNQWVGITDAPRTTILSIYGKKSDRVGLGGLVFNDQAAATSRIGGSASYTYSFNMTKSVKMSFALSGGFTQFKLIKQGLNVESSDPLISGEDIVSSAPDATFGFNMFGSNWYFGAAIPQLFGNNLDLISEHADNPNNIESQGKLAQHIYVMGAYKHSFNPFWSIEPSVLLKSVVAAPLQADFGIKTTFDDKFWLGMGYRNNGEMSALLGYSIHERYSIGYSYDILSSDMSAYSGGSHEFMIGIRF